jgi:hypothetical protein
MVKIEVEKCVIGLYLLYTSQNLLGTIFRVTFAVLYRRIWSIVGNYSILCCDSVHALGRDLVHPRGQEHGELGLHHCPKWYELLQEIPERNTVVQTFLIEDYLSKLSVNRT